MCSLHNLPDSAPVGTIPAQTNLVRFSHNIATHYWNALIESAAILTVISAIVSVTGA